VKKIFLILAFLLLSYTMLFGCMYVEEDEENRYSTDEGSLVSVPSGDNNSDANVNGPSAIPKLPALPQ
jgi:hypothetical protein